MPDPKTKEFEQKLMESEQKYKTIFENSAVAITVAVARGSHAGRETRE